MNSSFSSRPRGAAVRRARRWILVTTVVASTIGFSVAGAAIATQPPVVDDIQVNATGETGNNTTQSETSLAVNGNTICAGFNDSGNPAPNFSGFARSTNSGQAWTDQGELGAGSGGDPSIAVNNTTGTFYYAENATIGGNAAVGVARSTDNCATFGAEIDASPNSTGVTTVGNRTTFLDKPWITVDNTGGANNGNVYVCFTRFVDTTNPSDGNADTSELRFSRSTDGGATYVNEQMLAPQGDRAWGCSVHVGPNGQVHVTWAEGEGPFVGGIPTAGDLHHRVSTDGGQTFGVQNTIATAQRIAGSDRQVTCDGQIRRTLNGNIRMLHEAWNAVDATGGPFSGNIYVVWARDPAGTVDNSDVLFSRSADGGTTWSTTPIQLGATTATDQFEPFVAVGGRGVVSVAWYDRINDAANNLNIDVYKAFSTDGGMTFGAAERVTNQNFGVPGVNPTFLNPNFDNRVRNCYMGEYIGVAADADNFYYLWGDNRNTITNTAWPTGRPDPDVFFESERVPAGPPATLTLAPDPDSNPVDAQHCITATVQDIFGRGTPNITVRFTVSGSVNTSGSQATDANGLATFCYTGPALPGSDQISAFADTNNNTGQDTGEPGDTASKQWVLPASTPGCKVTDGGTINASNGDRATFGSFAAVSASGTPSGEQQFEDHGPAVVLNVHSTSVLAVVCGGRIATVFGTATVNGSGSVIYRIDLTDNGKPGVGNDTYRIRLSTGYDSGIQTLTGGNIQLR
ncbi:MAG: post-COAP-1 domain-containing protein [Mycetocola sp.]